MRRYRNYKKEESLEIDPYENFDGSRIELFLLKTFRRISQYKKIIFIFFLSSFVIFLGFAFFIRYQKYQFEQATLKIEEIQKTQKDQSKILKQYKLISNQYTENHIDIRLFKQQADTYARLEKFNQAAKIMENLAKKIENISIKAYFFYVSANFWENDSNFEKSEENYKTVISLIDKKSELTQFLYLTYYHYARIKLENNKKQEAFVILKDLINQDLDNNISELTDIKKMSVYLLITHQESKLK